MAATVMGTLAEEVADLLRHDNLDTRIFTWLRMAFNDMVSRMPVWRFYTVNATAIAFTADSDLESIAVETTSSDHQDPVVAIVLTATGTLYTPKYVPYGEFHRVAHQRAGGSPLIDTFPLIWSIGPASRYKSATLSAGRYALYFWPAPSANLSITLIDKVALKTTDPTASTRYALPYHMEHCLIWGAAYFGAKALRPQIAQIYLGEYEQAMQNLTWMLTYKPDATPVMRAVRGVYDGSSRLNTMPRIPNNIPSS